MEGNIVINGILASCHASVDHDLAHLGVAPTLWFPEIVELIFGEYGEVPAFVTIAEQVSKSIMPNDRISSYDMTKES